MWKTVFLIAFLAAAGNANECIPRSFGVNKIVCVCNATYCDDMPLNHPKVLEEGKFYWYLSAQDGRRLKLSEGEFDIQEQSTEDVLAIDSTKKYQQILGFGGAFTDAAGYNIATLSPATQEQLIRAYYDPERGSRYTLGRVPIGATDFSLKFYTLDDVEGDISLKKFALAEEDYNYKMPYLKQARKLNPNVKFLSEAWTPPSWMKTYDNITEYGYLKKEYYQLYAEYLVKFLDAYKSQGFDFWALTTGNEPTSVVWPIPKINVLLWKPENMSDWIANNLGPTLALSGHKTIIIAHNDQRVLLPFNTDRIFRNERVRNFTAGIGVHLYTDSISTPNVLDRVHVDYPEKFILMTEGCIGLDPPGVPHVDLGSWERGQTYMLSIIEYLNHWSAGWVDWNLVLDKSGGPNHQNSGVDSPIIANPETDEFYKQPMYYALKHFSRFMDAGSHRISITETDDIKATAALTPDNRVVVALYNKATIPKKIVLKDLQKGHVNIEVPPLSMNTVTYAL